MTRRFLLLFGLSAIAVGTDALAQVGRPENGLTISVSHVERNRYGYLITVEIINASQHNPASSAGLAAELRYQSSRSRSPRE